MSDNALAPVKGKVRRLLDQADRHVHIIEMAHTDIGFKQVGVFVTMGPYLIKLNEELAKLDVLPAPGVTVEEDYFPDIVIARLRKYFSKTLDLPGVKYEIHAAAICPAPAAVNQPGQE